MSWFNFVWTNFHSSIYLSDFFKPTGIPKNWLSYNRSRRMNWKEWYFMIFWEVIRKKNLWGRRFFKEIEMFSCLSSKILQEHKNRNTFSEDGGLICISLKRFKLFSFQKKYIDARILVSWRATVSWIELPHHTTPHQFSQTLCLFSLFNVRNDDLFSIQFSFQQQEDKIIIATIKISLCIFHLLLHFHFYTLARLRTFLLNFTFCIEVFYILCYF